MKQTLPWNFIAIQYPLGTCGVGIPAGGPPGLAHALAGLGPEVRARLE